MKSHDLVASFPHDGDIRHDIGADWLIIYKIFALVVVETVVFFQVIQTLRVRTFFHIAAGYASGNGCLQSLDAFCVYFFLYGCEPYPKKQKNNEKNN
jgi:hypothetical protein